MQMQMQILVATTVSFKNVKILGFFIYVIFL